MKQNKDIIAFVHLQKTAGMTLVHLLRSNFGFSYCDVRVLSSESNGIFQASDLKKVMKINPFVRCIGGHPVKPYGTLTYEYPETKFITILRDPIKRYLSQYQYKIEKRGHHISFEDFLKEEKSFNKQTKQLVGKEDLETAKEILERQFLLVGMLEEFDAFLILLKKKLLPLEFNPNYELQNVRKENSSVREEIENKFPLYKEQIIDQNRLDIELYDYVKNTIFPRQIEEYGNSFNSDVKLFQNEEKKYKNNYFRYFDYIFRKLYYDPAFRIIRKMNGLPATGIY